MRKVMAVILAAAVVVTFSTAAAFAAWAKSKSSQTTQPRRSYEQCHSLALQRGLNVSRRDRWQLDEFILGCQRGKIR
jgi:Spy/CpxP family protein refolding chaperone